MLNCEICGGSVLVNPDTAIGICDSCGNTVEIDEAVASKCKSVFRMAEHKMLLNSSKGYEEAIRLFESIEYVEGVKEKIEQCRNRYAELKKKESVRQKQAKRSESQDTKIGVLITVILVLAVLLFIAGLIFAAYKILSGKLEGKALYIAIIGFAVFLVVFVIGKAANR
ncbi:MAG: hypothetical protein K5756_03455 [Clostridiales bacterium]|nr:hypothetical protein [Clostridiales bacterium]